MSDREGGGSPQAQRGAGFVALLSPKISLPDSWQSGMCAGALINNPWLPTHLTVVVRKAEVRPVKSKRKKKEEGAVDVAAKTRRSQELGPAL